MTLLAALERLRDLAAALPLPLETPEADAARRTRAEMVAQVDDYLLPRLRQVDAPLLVVVGGSTGAGKSTLVNSLVRDDASPAGVRRPTTRAPVLVCAPADESWYADDRVLPGLARLRGRAPAGEPDGGHTTLRLVPSDRLRPGLALLDAPDIDSVVEANRELAAQLLAAADLWLFVTTAARYADAVPWDLLRTAQERATALAVVLNRVPPGAAEEVAPHLAEMLRDRGLPGARLFTLGEVPLIGGRLPEQEVGEVRRWLERLAADADARAAVVRSTLAGALASLEVRVPALGSAAAEQAEAAGRLADVVRTAYDAARDEVEAGVRDGSLLRGEVLARWQEVVGTGEFMRGLESRIGRARDRLRAALTGRPAPTQALAGALESGVETLVRAAAEGAAERSATAWRADPAGAGLLRPDLAHAAEDLPERAAVTVREWQGAVLDLVREEGADKRVTARVASYGVNGLGLVVMLAVFSHTGGLTGAEVAVAGGTSALGQRLLEAIFGDEAVRRMAARARRDLLARVDVLLGEEVTRYTTLLAAAPTAGDRATLDDALADIRGARTQELDGHSPDDHAVDRSGVA